jgi:hypothetical protein
MRHSKKYLINYLIENYNKKSKSEIISELDLSWTYLQKIASLNGIKREFCENKNGGKYSILTNYDNIISCYWLGFMLADGNISKKNNMMLNLAICDKDHILKIETHVGKTCVYYKKDNIITIVLNDSVTFKKIASDFNWKTNKTKNPPVLPGSMSPDCIFSMIIGFIDGDGCIDERYGLKVKCDGSWQDMLNYFHLILTGNSKKYQINNNGYSVFRVGDMVKLKDIKKKILDLGIPAMDRKWDKIDINRIYKSEKKSIISEMLNNGDNMESILEKTGFSKTLYYSVANKEGINVRKNKISDNQSASIVTMYNNGITTREISSSLKLSISTIHRHIKKYKEAKRSL